MIILKNILRQILFEQEEYRGKHEAPDKSNGAPLYDLTKLFPENIYSQKAAEYYGDRSTDYNNELTFSIIRYARNRPNQQIKIYRAVPSIITAQDKVKDLEKQKAYILKFGKIPNGTETRLNRSAYYDFISNELNKLKNSPTSNKKIFINPGDWVTINRQYAVFHGESTLLGKYKILSKIVPAKHLFTVGDDLNEFGYDPS